MRRIVRKQKQPRIFFGAFLVGEDGFEPSKSSTTDLQSAPFGHSGTPPYEVVKSCGAGGRTRTPDLLITNQLLYQLSYTSVERSSVTKGILADSHLFVNNYFLKERLFWIIFKTGSPFGTGSGRSGAVPAAAGRCTPGRRREERGCVPPASGGNGRERRML